MKAEEYCKTHEPVATHPDFGGVVIFGVEDEDGETYVYCLSGAMRKPTAHRFHRVKTYYGPCGEPFFHLFSRKMELNDCLRIKV